MSQRALGRVFLRQTPSQALAPGVSSRAFSESTRCPKEAVPNFSPTSSPELDALLSKFRYDLFIPCSLPPRHKKLVYKKKHAEQLLNQRITVNVKGSEEEIRLKPTSLADRPTNRDFKAAVTSMSTYSDWRNLIPLLTGLKNSKRGLQPERLEWLIRKACDAGKHGVILECARDSARTGLELRNVNVVRSLYQGFHSAAQKSNFGLKVVERSLKQAKQAAFLVGLPNKKGVSLQDSPTKQPDIIGVLLELSASRALQAFDGKDQENEVATYALRTIDTWPVGDFSVQSDAPWSTTNEKLKQMVPLWHGMKLGLKVREINASKDLRSNLQKRVAELEPNIKAAMKIVSGVDLPYTPQSLTMSQELFDKK